MITIYGRQNSINVIKALWCAEELGTPYERVDAGMAFGVVDTPEYRALNPNGRIPSLRHGAVELWESNAICRYLCLLEGGDARGLYPAAPGERASVERWLDWQLSTLSPVERGLFWGMVRTAPEARDEAAIRRAMEESAGCWAILDRRLADGRPFLEGASFTLADLVLGSYARRWFGEEVRVAGMPRFAALETWYARLGGRPGFRRWVAPRLT